MFGMNTWNQITFSAAIYFPLFFKKKSQLLAHTPPQVSKRDSTLVCRSNKPRFRLAALSIVLNITVVGKVRHSWIQRLVDLDLDLSFAVFGCLAL